MGSDGKYDGRISRFLNVSQIGQNCPDVFLDGFEALLLQFVMGFTDFCCVPEHNVLQCVRHPYIITMSYASGTKSVKKFVPEFFPLLHDSRTYRTPIDSTAYFCCGSVLDKNLLLP